MPAPSVTKNPAYPTQDAPFGAEARCGLTWARDVTVRYGRYSKALAALAPPELEGHGESLPAAVVVVREYLGTPVFEAALEDAVPQFEAFVNQGLIAGANAQYIETMLDRAMRYWSEAQEFNSYWGDEVPPSEHPQLYRLAIAAILNLRCAQEAMYSVALYERNMRTGTGKIGSITPRGAPPEPKSARFVPAEPEEGEGAEEDEGPPIIEEPPPEDEEIYDADVEPSEEPVVYPDEPAAEPTPEPAKKKSNTLLLVGVAAVAVLMLSRK